MTNPTFFETARKELCDKAYATYVANETEINRVRNGIEQNRKGQLPIGYITNDIDRLTKRIAREGMNVKDALERINGVPNFQDVAVIKKIVASATSVCRIIIRTAYGNSGYGTGFMISPNVLITNNHVLPDVETALRSEAQFNYEMDDAGQLKSPVSFKLRPDLFFLTAPYEFTPGVPCSGRDFTMVAVEPTGSDGVLIHQFGFIRMDSSLGKAIEGESCVIIQHPKGDYKKIVMKDIRLITVTDDFMVYESDTLPGSSGSVVLGLGTGAVIALHHSSIPRKDGSGNWLRKDGTPVQPSDPDELIDWIGNEGVRVSCIVDAFNKIPVPDSMQPLRREIIDAQTTTTFPMNPSSSAAVGNSTPATQNILLPKPNGIQPESTSRQQYFEVLLSAPLTLQQNWTQKAAVLIEGLVSDTPLIAHSADPLIRRMRYLTVQSNKNPWELAAFIESLPQVESCRPDLETLTDVGVGSPERTTRPGAAESSLIINNGTAVWNEGEFLKNFETSKWVVDAKNVRPDYYRWWNWRAINCPEDSQRTGGQWDVIRKNLSSLRLVQLDTGYSLHSKLFAGIDTSKDFDFIDADDDARDRMDRLLLKFPGHGTRTGSLTIGGPLAQDPFRRDGNGGLLNFGGSVPSRLIAYRIAKSVILLGRGKQLIDAAAYAISSQADVMFMCMGTYPKAAFAAMVREVYENGIIWVCAAGNEVELVVAPALYPGTIAVAATNPNDSPWKGSSNGPAVDIAAPGESVYVPFIDKAGSEIMAYGDGTSYATPQVASAAMLWKAKHQAELDTKYPYPWQVVEAFRYCLTASARRPDHWNTDAYGAGILHIDALLAQKLPDSSDLKHAYKGVPDDRHDDLGIVEAVHFVWNILRRKVTPGLTESLTSDTTLTARGQLALKAFTSSVPAQATESVGLGDEVGMELLLRDYFNRN